MRDPAKRLQDLISPRQQRNWDWRAAANFVFGGAGGGLLLMTAFAAAAGAGPVPTRVGTVLGLLLIASGLTCVWFEIGRPWRALNVYRHIATSWMTREAWVAAAIFPLGLATAFTTSSLLQWLLGLLGLAFVYSQARILSTNKGIPIWRHPRSVALVLTTGLAEGAGFMACVLALAMPASGSGIIAADVIGDGRSATTSLAMIVSMALITLIVLRVMFWRVWVAALHLDGAPAGSLSALAAIESRFVLIGHILPTIGIVLAIAISITMAPLGTPTVRMLMLAAGLLTVAGGWLFKHTLVLRAAFTQGVALNRLPVRGSGPAGAGIKPGWRKLGS